MRAPRSALDEQRTRGAARAQLPFLISVVIVAVLVAVVTPDIERDPVYLVGLALVAAASALCVILVLGSLRSQLLIVVPALDLIAVAGIRDSANGAVPAVPLLVIFPLLWLVFGFARGGAVVAVAGAAFIAVFPIIRYGGLPGSPLGWSILLGTPLLTALLVTAAAQAAAEQRTTRRELAEATEAQARLLDDAREQAAVIAEVADVVDVGIVYFDADDRAILRNAAVRRLLVLAGYDHETGMATSVFGSDRVTRVAEDHKLLLEALYADRVHGPVYWVGEPGNQRALTITVRTIVRGGRRTGSVLAAYDVTDLAQAVQVRDEFLATVSHELRTPLTSIVGYMDLLDEMHDPDEMGIGAELAVIQRNVDQLSTIIASLLAGADHAPALVHADVDLSVLVRDAVEAARPRVEERHLSLGAAIMPGVTMHGDAGRLSQVVDALLSNASVYTPSGRVDVALERDGAEAVITVTDTGVGMSAEDQLHVFDRFFRAQTARDTALPGLGLGLSIAERTVQEHGGRIAISSALGHGTRAEVRLPLRPPRSAVTPE